MKTLKSMVCGATLMLALILTATSCSGNGNVGGNLEYSEDELQVKPFKKIDVQIVANVYYTQNDGDQCKVRIDYSDIQDEDVVEQLKKIIKVVYRDNGVIIGMKGKIKNLPNKKLKIYITSPDLVSINQESVGSFYSDNINSDVLEIDNEGVGSVHIKNILANRLEIDNEGVGSVNVDKFTGDKLTIDNEGVGKVMADVDCKSVEASLDGVGSITLTGKTHYFSRSRDGVGSIHAKDLKVLK